ncbi:hypothetical protein ACF0H5_006581 [Mactra antiquata]
MRQNGKYTYLKDPTWSTDIQYNPNAQPGRSPDVPLLKLDQPTSITKIATYIDQWFKQPYTSLEHFKTDKELHRLYQTEPRMCGNQLTYVAQNDTRIKMFQNYLVGDDNYDFTHLVYPIGHTIKLRELHNTDFIPE